MERSYILAIIMVPKDLSGCSDIYEGVPFLQYSFALHERRIVRRIYDTRIIKAVLSIAIVVEDSIDRIAINNPR